MAFFDPSQEIRLPDGRLQLRHGPIDLIIEAFGSAAEVAAAYRQAGNSFSTVLEELVTELQDLRKQTGAHTTVFEGAVASNMARVAESFSNTLAGKIDFITPMISVAGAVADHVLQRMIADRQLSKAYVNNGGDIALYINEAQSFNIGVCANPLSGRITSTAKVDNSSPVRGVATSGWRGRSHSLGIADSVTVLASTAARADAAATLIANVIDLPCHRSIKRTSASELQPDSDLGDRLVTVDVGELNEKEVTRALESGQSLAKTMIDAGHVEGVFACLNSQSFALKPVDALKTLHNGRPSAARPSRAALACA